MDEDTNPGARVNDQADVGLIAACQQGDARAFRKVFDIYRDRIYALCRHMSGNAEDAEDLCQEAFVSAFRNIGTYRADAAFGTWLYRIAANRCTAELRKWTPKFRSFNAANETELSCMEKRHRAGQALMATAGVGGGLFGGGRFPARPDV
ncbi:MAG: sigma-70 family RNA polymerase sigma factor [Candidatus Latescibacteria bacterium]|nr:sigma-70 family RNA polymerase sigma factor [Candidatus Latescibacterota bacterium]